MKRLLILFLLISSFAYAQDTITIHHSRYTTTFDTVLKYPVLVHWVVNASDLCDKFNAHRVERKTSMFKPDPLLKRATNLQRYYTRNKGKYQRGHNMDAADNSCDVIGMEECFYFSNMTPQTKELNERSWNNLEDKTRRLAKQYGKVEVWCGSYGVEDKIGKVSVPAYCWKILKYNGQEVDYIFPNTHEVNIYPITHYKSSIATIRKESKLVLPGL